MGEIIVLLAILFMFFHFALFQDMRAAAVKEDRERRGEG